MLRARIFRRPFVLAGMFAAVAGCTSFFALAEGVQKLEEVEVVGSGRAVASGADSANQGTVSQKQIEAQPNYRPGEILEAAPGLIVTQHSGEGKANQYFLRGINLDHGTDIAITVDEIGRAHV